MRMFDAVVKHLETCKQCLSGPPCNEAHRLAQNAIRLFSELQAPIPEFPKSPYKA